MYFVKLDAREGICQRCGLDSLMTAQSDDGSRHVLCSWCYAIEPAPTELTDVSQ
jgi:hypothetical protein